jgi:predicted dehydrogenase
MILHWGIIGCGDVTEVKSGPAFNKIDGSRLVAVMRRDGGKAADYARRHGVPRWYDDAQRLIDDPDVNIVYIATPPGSHAEYACRVAAAGKPCYVEKPMARNAVEGERMVRAFADAGQKLFVAYYRRRLPTFVRAAQLIQDNAIGTVTGVSHRHASPAHRRSNCSDFWRVNVEQSGGGLFMDLASHVFDVLDMLLGPFSNVSANAANVASAYDAEDVVSVTWRFPAGSVGSSIWNFASDVSEDVIEISGTDGRITFSAFSARPVRLIRGGKVDEFPEPYPPHVQQPLIQSIVDDLNHRGPCPSTGESALRTQRVLDTCLEDFYGGRVDDFWKRPRHFPNST